MKEIIALLKVSINAKKSLLEEYRALARNGQQMYAIAVGFVEINIDELERILADLEAVQAGTL